MSTEQSQPFKILFLCTGNSARSILAEYLIRNVGRGRFESYSAGADPTGRVNPYALRVLREAFHIDASDACSKSWDEFRDVRFDFVITVCDAAAEACPAWPGQPIMAHWPAPDSARFHGTEAETYKHFWKVAQLLYRRIDLFCCLPIKSLDRLRLERATRDIARQEDAF
jgi:arsenate reductase (thioredoxin)